jgi:drug/metabolite transporter (DMT)-like permease
MGQRTDGKWPTMPNHSADSHRIDLRRGSLWMLGSLVGFTVMALLIKHLGAARGVSAWWALLFRAGVGLGLVWLLYAPRGQVSFKRALTGRMLVSRGVMGAFGTAAYYITLPILGAGKATLIGNTWVIWAALLAVPILGETLTLRKVAGMILAVAGIVFITGLQGGDLSLFGKFEVMAIAGAFISAGVVVVIRQLTRTETSGTIFASQCIYTGLLALPFCVTTSVPGWMDLGLLILAAVMAAWGQIGMTEGFRYLPVSIGGAFQILLPLCITVFGWLFLAETFTQAQVIGALLILAGCYGVIVQSKR